MKIQNDVIHNGMVSYTQAVKEKAKTHSFEEIISHESQSSSSSPSTTDSLVLLLQGTSAYTGYIESMIEQDILTEAERQYLLTGDIERIEKKNMILS